MDTPMKYNLLELDAKVMSARQIDDQLQKRLDGSYQNPRFLTFFTRHLPDEAFNLVDAHKKGLFPEHVMPRAFVQQAYFELTKWANEKRETFKDDEMCDHPKRSEAVSYCKQEAIDQAFEWFDEQRDLWNLQCEPVKADIRASLGNDVEFVVEEDDDYNAKKPVTEQDREKALLDLLGKSNTRTRSQKRSGRSYMDVSGRNGVFKSTRATSRRVTSTGIRTLQQSAKQKEAITAWQTKANSVGILEARLERIIKAASAKPKEEFEDMEDVQSTSSSSPSPTPDAINSSDGDMDWETDSTSTSDSDMEWDTWSASTFEPTYTPFSPPWSSPPSSPPDYHDLESPDFPRFRSTDVPAYNPVADWTLDWRVLNNAHIASPPF